MAKTAPEQSLSPVQVTLGAAVRNAHVLATSRALAYAAAYRSATVHLSLGSVPGSVTGFVFGASGGAYVTELETEIWIDADTQTVELGAEVVAAAASTLQIRWTIGSGVATTTHTTAENGTEVATTLTPGAIGGTGWQRLAIEVRCTAGNGPGSELATLRVQDGIIAPADLPDPA
jgi:hypothetical protein